MFREIVEEESILVVEEKVSPHLEMTSYLRENQEKVVLFKRVEGKFPGWVVGNAFSTRERIARWLNIPPGDIAQSLSMMMEKRGEIREVRGNFEEEGREWVSRLPIPTYYSGDGGPYITSAVFSAEAPGGWVNLSFHRMMLLSPPSQGRFAVRLVPRHLYRIYGDNIAQGEDTPVSISIGVDPWFLIAAATSLPWRHSEMEYAAALKEAAGRGPLEVCRTDGYPPYPADAEIVLLGRLIDERVPEGPFVDITSTRDYSGMGGQPVLQVEKVLFREKPLFHALLPAGYEHFLLMGLPREVSMFRSVSEVVPDVRGVRLTEGGAGWLHAVVSIKKQKEGDGKNAIMAAFTGHPSLKHVVVVDEDVNVNSLEDVEWAIATRFQADKDLVVVKGARGSTLDPSSDGMTAKMGLDATAPIKERARFLRVESGGDGD